MTRIGQLRVRTSPAKRELFSHKKPFAFWVFLLLSLLALAVSLTAFENLRVTVDRTDISIPLLPQAFEGYTVLVVGDLHNRTFQRKQEGILRAIGQARYDVVLFTGDMTTKGEEDPTAFYALVDALGAHGKPMYYTKGNHDPDNWLLEGGACVPSPYLAGLLERGVQLLDRPYELRQGDAGNLWLWPLSSVIADAEAAAATARANIALLQESKTEEDRAAVAYSQLQLEGFEAQIEAAESMGETDVHIAAGHYPLTPSQVSLLLQQGEGMRPRLADVDLAIAGHYHAGQWRVPLLGAVYVPAPELPRGGWFPDQEVVAGPGRIDGFMQYITRGMGSAGPKPLRFRLFNPPELALLRLTSRVS